MDATDEPLWRILQPLRSVACWLMTGAHPDDEWSGFLAWLAFGRGVHTVYACATRGEGGQNALGPERGPALAALRSREMERAAGELGLAVRWIGDDDIFSDFGFSKSAEDTLRRWGEARLVNCLVRLIRTERPDALSPTFLDVPGQHGHHRAITRSTLQAAELAADPGFVVPECALPAWGVAKIYLPAFSGAGGSYDDLEPPPPETVRVDLGSTCPVLADTWARLGERSRRCHASQGMGRDVVDGPRPFPLHLAAGIPDAAMPMDGIAHSVGELAGTLPKSPATLALHEIDAMIAEALTAFPDRRKIAEALHRALATLARTVLPAGADDIGRRLHLKRRQLGRAAAIALGIDADLSVTPEPLRAGGKATVSLVVHGPATAGLRVPSNWRAANHDISIPPDATPFGTLRKSFDPLGGDDVIGATLTWIHHGSSGKIEKNPRQRISLAPEHEPKAAPPRLPRASIAIDAKARVGVIAGNADETLGWLRQLDITAEAVTDATLAAGDLERFSTLLVGVFAFGQRPALRTHRDRLIAWIEAGGSLVTMYHRPGDGWDEGRTPPRRLVIGSPSFRWRVTDPAAPVTVLAPEHPLMTTPNTIGPADWNGWVRERGLYFASDWDPAYRALIELSDLGEPPLCGALLAAPVGTGRHVHVALALHHQFPALVPGAFRLLANLVACK